MRATFDKPPSAASMRGIAMAHEALQEPARGWSLERRIAEHEQLVRSANDRQQGELALHVPDKEPPCR